MTNTAPAPLLTFAIAAGATLLGSMSGSSTSLITTPTWLMLGIPLPLAVANDKLCGAMWTLPAGNQYLRRQSADWKLLAGMAPVGLLGAFVGTRVTTHVDAALLKPIVGAALLILITISLLHREFGIVPEPPRTNRALPVALSLPLGCYEGMLGSGNGILSVLMLCRTRGFDLPTALGHYYVIAALWCAFAATLYIFQGYYDLRLMIPAVLGSLLGGAIGSRIGSRRGSVFLKPLFLSVGLIFSLKLLLPL